MNRIKVHRGLAEVAELPLNSSVFDKYLMGIHELAFNFTSPTRLDLRVGDTLTYKGEVMTVNKEPDITISHLFAYSVTFQGHRHTLERFIIKDEGSLVFDYTGQLDDFLAMYIESVNSVDSGWTLGEIKANTALTTLSFDKSDSLTALSDIAEAFGCEWQIIGKEVSVVKSVGNATTLEFSYGKGNGLYSLSQLRNDQSKIVTRAYAVGGSKNLPASYPHTKLTLAGYIEDATAVGLYGIREGVIEDEEIFPQRTSTATGVAKLSDKLYSIIDSTLDFDLNGQRIDSQEAYIVFKSGMLNSQQFKITKYDHASKTIRYEANEDSNGNLIPFGVTIADVGDEYTLIGIRMPSTYETAALNELAEKRGEYLNENKNPKVRYELDVDILHLKRLGVEPQEGDLIRLQDDRFSIDVEVRITSISYPGQYNPMESDNLLSNDIKFKCELSNDIHYYRVQRIEKEIKDTKKAVTQVSRTSWENDRRNIIALDEFKGKVFDPDENLEEALIQGIAALFGSESMYFDLDPSPEITITNTALEISSTKLIHKKYAIAGLGYTWDLSAFLQSGLEAEKAYYLAAKVSKSALTGVWVLSEEQITTDEEVGFWHFNLGVLSSVIEGSRSFRTTKMFTLISGGNIETDVITAYLINVHKLFAQIIEVGSNGYTNAIISGLDDRGSLSQRFASGIDGFENRYNAPFQVLDDGSMSSSKGKIGGFMIDSTTLRSQIVDSGGSPTGASSGIVLSDLGVLSRNAGMSFLPASTGFDFAASLVGEVSEPRPSIRPSFFPNIRSGVFGIRRQELTSAVLDLLEGAWGVYGAMFTSVKFLSAIYEPIRLDTSSSDLYLTENDYYVAKSGDGSVYLPTDGVEKGRKIIVKNAQGGVISVYGNGFDVFRTNNSVGTFASLDSGFTRSFRFSGTQWIESDAG